MLKSEKHYYYTKHSSMPQVGGVPSLERDVIYMVYINIYNPHRSEQSKTEQKDESAGCYI